MQPEVRYWLCEASNGHFIGIHGIVTKYNIAGYSLFSMLDKNYRYEGWGAGVGINYGYSWAFSKRWGIEAYLGIGIVQFTFERQITGTGAVTSPNMLKRPISGLPK